MVAGWELDWKARSEYVGFTTRVHHIPVLPARRSSSRLPPPSPLPVRPSPTSLPKPRTPNPEPHTITPTAAGDLYPLVISAAVPRPVAFISSVDSAGAVNLSPYSFFNAMGKGRTHRAGGGCWERAGGEGREGKGRGRGGVAAPGGGGMMHSRERCRRAVNESGCLRFWHTLRPPSRRPCYPCSQRLAL